MMSLEETARHFSTLNLYARLGVGEGATDQEIRRAYRRLLKRVHPDLNGDQGEEARARFDEIMRAANEARDILLDPEKRARYDLRLRGRRSPRTVGDRDHRQRHWTRDARHASAQSSETEESGCGFTLVEWTDFHYAATPSLSITSSNSAGLR